MIAECAQRQRQTMLKNNANDAVGTGAKIASRSTQERRHDFRTDRKASYGTARLSWL